MTGARFLVLLFLCALLASRASADGKFYSTERIPELPFQRAVIWHDGTREIMVVQSRYDAKSSPDLKDVGWVVPVPSIPGVGTMSATAATMMFTRLERQTQPERIVYVDLIWNALDWLIVGVFGLALVRTLLLVVANTLGYRGQYRKYLGSGRNNAALIVITFLLSLCTSVKYMSMEGVEVVSETTAGVYEIKVVKSDSPAALIDWLKQHGFRYDASDERIFADYIGRGWCFVTARIASVQKANNAALDAQSMVNPLVLRFATKEAVYPLALTAAAGQVTEVLLYSFAAHKTDTGGRLSPEFAIADGQTVADFLKNAVEPARLLGAETFPERYLTKMRGRLSAEQMRTDLVLKQAPNDEPYRMRVYSWTQPPRAKGVPEPHYFEPELHLAARNADLARVESLLDGGSPVDMTDALQETALHAAAHAGKTDVAAYLISRKANVNARSSNGDTPLAHAAGAGQKAAVELLLASGAEIDLAQRNFTPLGLAIKYGHDEVARLLIDKGANVEHDALDTAAQFGRHEIAKLLIAREANVNGLYGPGGGRFPLSLAAQNGNLQMVQLLIEHGADVNGKDAVGTPLGLTRSPQVRDYLVAKGAR